MYVRLAFAVAAHLEPDVLVVDEVLAVGDQAFQQKCLGRMEAVSADGRTVLFVSHSMSAIEQLCSRVIVLQRGCLVADGTPQDIIAGYLSQVSHTSVGPVDLTEVPRSNAKTKPIIHELTLRDGLGEPCGTFGTEEPMVIDFLLRPPFTLREPRLAAAVEETTGRRLTTVASYFTLDGLDEIDGPCRIRCTIPRLPLGPGRYLISISLVDKYLGTLDALDNIVSFDVEWRNGYGTGEDWYPFYGPVMTSSRWQRADGEDVLVLDLERERAGGR
jgi:lipopolysaccharide transport system ATP-binding protein